MSQKKKIKIPESYNYVAAFLTFACNLRCSYCINRYEESSPKYERHMTGDEWIEGINRLVLKRDMPVTLQGGEPTLHPDFYKIVNGIRKDIPIDLLTNAQFDVDEFMANVKPERIKRHSPYASIRVSWHPETMSFDTTIKKVLKLLNNDYHVGIWAVDHPSVTHLIRAAFKYCADMGIDFRIKEFLGFDGGRMYGSYKYPDMLQPKYAYCLCKPSELLIAPDGGLHRCHRDVYNNFKPYDHILDDEVKVLDDYKGCFCPVCNPCDIKIKTNRFQEYGHTSVEIKEII